jgi:hypothetical protein
MKLPTPNPKFHIKGKASHNVSSKLKKILDKNRKDIGRLERDLHR